jgi:NADH-quinone oxidoreductase subunit N
MELNLNLFVPELFLAASGIFMIVLDFLVPTRAKNRTFALLTALAGAVAVFLVVLFTPFSPEEAFNGFIKKDYLALLSQVLILFTLLLTVLVSYDYP